MSDQERDIPSAQPSAAIPDLRARLGEAHDASLDAAPAATQPTPTEVRPDGRLHADGYFTWLSGARPAYLRDQGLPCDFYLKPPATQPEGQEAIRRAVAALAHYAEYGHIDDDVVALIADLQYPIAARAAQAGGGNHA